MKTGVAVQAIVPCVYNEVITIKRALHTRSRVTADESDQRGTLGSVSGLTKNPSGIHFEVGDFRGDWTR